MYNKYQGNKSTQQKNIPLLKDNFFHICSGEVEGKYKTHLNETK